VLAQRGYADSNKDWMLSLGGINASVEAMRRFPEDKGVQLACAGAAGGQSLFNRGNMALAGELGAVELVVAIMRRWPEDPTTQIGGVSGCFMDFSAVNRDRWARAGGIELNIASVRTHYSRPDVVVQAAYGFSSGTHSPNEQRFADAGGIELVVDLMRDHAKSVRVREECMQATRPLVELSDSLRAHVVEAGYIPWLVATMRDAPTDKHQLQLACANLRELAGRNATHLAMAVKGGAAPLALRAVREASGMGADGTHQEYIEASYTVREDCTELLAVLAGDDQARQELLQANATQELTTLLQQQPSNKRFQVKARELLHKLA